MKNESYKNKHFKLAALPLCVATVLGVAAPTLGYAQQTEDEEVEVIDVTGSRIPTDPNVVSSVPVQSISEDDIRLSGELNLADVVNDIPALISSTTAENSANGANALNLRGLGGERTLTLVNGRRHVAGFRGTQAVDIGSIPRALVKRVEVTTGGASAVYGADAVTGVVNFILRDDFEGFQFDARGAVPQATGGQNFSFDILYGANFDDDNGNLVVSATFEQDEGLTYGDRDWARNNGISSVRPGANPDTSDGAPPRAIINNPTFWLTSQYGSIAPGFGGRDVTYVDINNNGIADCQESQGGRVGFLAGCWVTEADGTVRVNTDGTVLNGLWGIGGDGGQLNFNRDSLFPDTDKAVINVNLNYDFTNDLRGFLEAKYVHAESTTFNEQDTFYDTLFIRSDNPYIPEALRPVVDVTGGLLLTQDPLDFSDNNESVFSRVTTRLVAGFNWDYSDDHSLEFSLNHGVFTRKDSTTGLYLDRVFAAMDAVRDENGNIVCRSDIDPTASYEIDYFSASNGFANGAFSSNRYYSFTPGDGQCAPLNPFGIYSASEAAQNFVTSHLNNKLTIKQSVASLLFNGEFDLLESVLDDRIGYASGLEYRKESSDNQLDPITLGILPQGTSFTPGVQVSTVDPFLFSYTSIDNAQQFNTKGDYSVFDAFLEVRLPIFLDRGFAKELTLDGAIRFSDYSTLGNTTTWKLGLSYAPVDDFAFRGTISEAVRAPNITELFDPRLPITVSATADPCDPGNVGTGSSVRQANCVSSLQAAGVTSSDILDDDGNYVWVNPLTGRFSGVSGGNPDLDVETARTVTIGAVFTPTFVEDLYITIDAWDVKIENAIAAVTAADILTGCFDSSNFPNLDFCNQFTRRGDGGLNSLETGETNFAKQEARGIDFSVNYAFDVDENRFSVALVGSRQNSLNNFFNPLDLNDVNPELEEIQIPKTSANLSLGWERGDIAITFQTTYQSRQAVAEIEDVLGLNGKQALYGDAGFFGETFIHDINASYQYDDTLVFYGGINNLGDEDPFSTQTAWPVGPRGRTFFLGVSYSHK